MADFKLGKKAPIHDSRTLRFGTYLTPELPAPPMSVDRGANVSNWPLYGNDKYNDCTCAAAGHMIEAWTANGRGLVVPAEDDVLALYAHFVGDYEAHPHGDCFMLDVLKYWRSSGLGNDRITAFGQLELKNDAQARDAIFYFGALYIGIALPDFVMKAPDKLKVPWEVPPQGPVGDAAPNDKNGHCVAAIAYDARNISIVARGTVKPMSWQFYNAYVDEAYAVLSSDFLGRRGSPSGFKMQQLEADLAEIERIPATSARFVNTAGYVT
jgi:hypothetical protein